MKRAIKYFLLPLVLLLTTLLYLKHFDNSFHFDDTHTIVDNSWIRSIGNIPDFYVKGSETFSTLPANQMYRPLVSTTLAIDHYLSRTFSEDGTGYHPFFYHLDSFFWFLLVLVFVFLLSRKLLGRFTDEMQATLLAGVATLILGIHGAMGETVNYIISRSDILSTAGILGGLVVYLYSPRLRKTYLYLLPVIAGLMAKSTTAMFYPVFLAWLILVEHEMSIFSFIANLFRGERRKEAWMIVRKSIPAFLVVGLVSYFTLVIMRAETFNPSDINRIDYLITQPWVILHYFVAFFLPVHLSADTDWTILPGITDTRFIVGAVFCIALLLTCFELSRRKSMRILSFALLFFLFTLLPTSSIISLSEVMNDHRMFLPFTGLAIGLAVLLYLAWDKVKAYSTAKYIFMAIMLLWFIFQADILLKRNEVWHDEASLWKDVTIKSPQNARGQMNFGLTLMEDANYDEALSYFHAAERISPNYPYLLINLAIAYNAKGDASMAEAYFGKALQYGGHLHEADYYYGRYLKQNNRLAESRKYLESCLVKSPGYMAARHLLLEVLSILGDDASITRVSRQGLELDPSDELSRFYYDQSRLQKSTKDADNDTPPILTKEAWLSRSLELYNTGDYSACIDACTHALEIDPNYALAYNNMCTAYNMLGRYQEASEACAKALEIEPDMEIARNNLKIARQGLAD